MLRNGAAGRAFISGRQLESPKKQRYSGLQAQWGCSKMTFHIQICHSNGILATFKTARLAFLHCWNFYRWWFFSFLLFGFITVSEEDWIGCQCEKGNWGAMCNWLANTNTHLKYTYIDTTQQRGKTYSLQSNQATVISSEHIHA